MVTSRQHIYEINHAPVHQLSLHAVAKEFLQPKYTMHGFEWKDIRGVEGTGFVRALRHTLTNYLPNLTGSLGPLIADEITKGVKKSPVITTGQHRVSLYPLAKRLVARANCLVFFGQELCDNPEFFEAAHQFPHDAALAAEIIRILPLSIGRLVARCATKNHRASLTFYKHLETEVTKRIENCNDDAYQGSSKQDGLQWLIDTAPKKAAWSVHRIVGEVMGIWYGSVHTLGIGVTYALHDIYSHPECMDPIIQELKNTDLEAFSGAPHELPVLDSVLKESARLSAFECTGIRRKALEPFTFSDGLSVARGEWVCVPHRSMMRDSRFFPNALEFQPFRFYQPPKKDGGQVFPNRGSFLTDASDSWLVWGSGRILCPGRFYATAVQKLVVAQMLLGYDCELAPLPGPRSVQWRSTIVPKPSIQLLVKEKKAWPNLNVE
ncbi:cytochrome P450 [Apiospora arundinis]|uniref:Cytochrome P450 n=1 Tax=Apiospora arundinis TaxID=335852 RepID=A0ABR2HQ90_9PEZI